MKKAINGTVIQMIGDETIIKRQGTFYRVKNGKESKGYQTIADVVDSMKAPERPKKSKKSDEKQD